MEVADVDAPVDLLSWKVRMDARRSWWNVWVHGREVSRNTPVDESAGLIVNVCLGIRHSVKFKNLPRSMNCEMQARNRSFSEICKQWEQLWSCRLKGFNTTVVGPWEVCRLCRIVFGLEFTLLVCKKVRDFGVWCDWKSATWRSPDLTQIGKSECCGIVVW